LVFQSYIKQKESFKKKKILTLIPLAHKKTKRKEC